MIGEDLHLDVARAIDAPFDVQRPVAEGGHRFAPRRLNGLERFRPIPDLAHALAPAAGRRLDDGGEAHARDRLLQRVI
jgi:hypothetical protein